MRHKCLSALVSACAGAATTTWKLKSHRGSIWKRWIKPPPAKPIVLPYPSIGSLFKGRGEFLARLRASLARGGQTAIVSQALYGLGGIGKTRAAVEYAWAHRDHYSALLPGMFILGPKPVPGPLLLTLVFELPSPLGFLLAAA